MKEDTHPESRPVIFHDTTSGEKFLFDSTVATEETGEYEGDEYPKTSVEMSSQSHPFYTGVERVVDTTGQVEKFKARFEKAEGKQNQVEKESETKDDKNNSKQVKANDSESESSSSEAGAVAEGLKSESAGDEAEPQEDDTEDSEDNESDSSDDEVAVDANT
jgi:large subunit ribosomal protein L31